MNQLRPRSSYSSGLAEPEGWKFEDLVRRISRRFTPWFWFLVVLPTAISGIYFFVIASDSYMSETRFIVRSQNRQSQSVLGQILQSTGVQSSGDDSSAVQSFITSREAVQSLEAKHHLRLLYSRPEADFVTRFPGVFSRSSFEQLYRHYLRFVEITFDSSTGVTTLRVQASRPEDAQEISRALLEASEQLVNKLNARAEADAVGLASRQLAEAEQRLSALKQQMTVYRLEQRLLDPKLTSASVYATVGTLMNARSATAAQLSEVTSSAPQSPNIPTLKSRLTALDVQINQAIASAAGSPNSIAGKIGEYERLSLEEEIGSKLLASATVALATARVEAQSKHLYIEHIAEPNLSDYPLYPRRVMDFCITFAVCMLIYGIAWLLLTAVREHGEA